MKYIEYIGFAPELFDLVADLDKAVDLAATHPDVVARLAAELRTRLDPDAADAAAFAAQDALVESFGGKDVAITIGAGGATPPPAAK